MKLKLFVLLLAVCLVLIGCDSAESKKPAGEPGTTSPAQGSSDVIDSTQPLVPDGTVGTTLPDEFHGIELPFDEFPDDVPTPVPVTQPSEPETEPPVEETDPPEVVIPDFDPDNLPMDEWV